MQGKQKIGLISGSNPGYQAPKLPAGVSLPSGSVGGISADAPKGEFHADIGSSVEGRSAKHSSPDVRGSSAPKGEFHAITGGNSK